MNKKITPLEETVLNLFGSRSSKHQMLLSTQISQARIKSRQTSKIGFITKFTVPNSITTLATMSKNKVFEIYAEHPQTHAGAEFSLWFEYGKLKYLEGYVFVGQWPTEEYKFHFSTIHGALCSDLVNRNNPNHKLECTFLSSPP